MMLERMMLERMMLERDHVRKDDVSCFFREEKIKSDKKQAKDKFTKKKESRPNAVQMSYE